ncbi:MAG: hypothetical protein ACI4TK_07830, partial [Agathobacter sp.]
CTPGWRSFYTRLHLTVTLQKGNKNATPPQKKQPCLGKKETLKPLRFKDFMELLPRFELGTSSLPKSPPAF